jgi:hypothetical protein
MSTKKLFLSAALFAFSTLPMISTASAQDRDDHARQQEQHRYYDSVRRDYHPWNDDEDRRYREFVTEHHWKYRDFSRLNKRNQRAYWQWRHDHEGHEERR